MKLNENLYSVLTAEERFRLYFAAGARGDEAEQSRLKATGKRIHLSFQDHFPFASAFDELAWTIFIELTDLAASYLENLERASNLRDDYEFEDATDEPETDPDSQSLGEKLLQCVLYQGFMLKIKIEGWQLFCERLTIPPFALWQVFPGFERLQRAVKLTEKVAFVPEGVLRWINNIRPDGAPEQTEVPYTAEGMANSLGDVFQRQVAYWSG